MQSKRLTIILAAILILCIGVAVFVSVKFLPEINGGEKNITFTIVNKDKTEEVIKIDTDAQFLADALVEEGIIVYEPSGLYTTIGGITADYNVDGGWWAVYEGGEMASVGLNGLPIQDGGEYEAVYTTEFIA